MALEIDRHIDCLEKRLAANIRAFLSSFPLHQQMHLLASTTIKFASDSETAEAAIGFYWSENLFRKEDESSEDFKVRVEETIKGLLNEVFLEK